MEGKRRRVSAAKAVVALAAVMLAALLLSTPAMQGFVRDVVLSPFQPRYPEEVTYTLERRLIVTAEGVEVTGYTFDIPEPQDIEQDGVFLQKVNSVTYSPEVTDRSERYGLNWVEWKGSVPEGGQMVCTVTYDVTVRTHFWNIDEDSSLGVEDVPSDLREQYLHDEWLINITAPEIVAQSKAIVGDQTNVYAILRDIYDWMLDNIEYPSSTLSGDPRSSVQTLRSGVGDCDDQSILFIALARAAGVPAWLQLGALYVEQERRWGGHGWLQAYVPLEDGGGANVSIDVVNEDFLVQQPNRLTDYTDDGDADHLEDYYYTFSSTFDRGERAPVYTEEYVRLSYQESYKKVSQGTVYELDVDAILPGTALRPLRT